MFLCTTCRNKEKQLHVVPLKTIVLILGRCMGQCSLTVYKTPFWITRGLEQLHSNFGGLRSNSLPVQCTSKEIRICFHVVRIKIRSINLNGKTMSYIFSCFLFYVCRSNQTAVRNEPILRKNSKHIAHDRGSFISVP